MFGQPASLPGHIHFLHSLPLQLFSLVLFQLECVHTSSPHSLLGQCMILSPYPTLPFSKGMGFELQIKIDFSPPNLKCEGGW